MARRFVVSSLSLTAAIAVLVAACQREAGRHMQANILGFQWNLGGGATLANLFERFQNLTGPTTFQGYERRIFVSATDRYYTGLLLTMKRHRRFCEYDERALRINVREVQAGFSLIDFNFFVVRKTTARGFFQHYHHSCHPNVFSKFCRQQFAAIQDELLAKELAAAGGDAITDRDKLRIESKYEEPFTWDTIVRRESFDALVQRFEKISSFECSFAAVAPEEERRFRPFRGVSRLIRHKVGFTRSSTLRARKDAILGFLRGQRGAVADASVHGLDADGLEKTIALYDNPDSFGHYDFDDMTLEMGIEPSDFANSAFMREMIRVADAHRTVLDARVR